MKKGKRVFLLILVLLLCLTAGCAASGDGMFPTEEQPVDAPPVTTAPADATEPDATLLSEPPVTEKEMYPEGEVDISVKYLPETVDNPDDLPILKWVCLMLNRKYIEIQWTEDVAIRLNRMLADSNAPFRVQFVVATQADADAYIGHAYYEWMYYPELKELASGADLLFGFFEEADLPRYLYPITESVQGDGENPLADAVPHEVYWLNGYTGGEIYGMYSNSVSPWAEAWMIDEAVFARFGLTQRDFQCQYWQMDEVFAELYEKNGRKPFLYGDLRDGYTYNQIRQNYTPCIFTDTILARFQTVTSCYAIDYTDGTPKVVNFLDTDYAREMLSAYQRYRDAGYLTEVREQSLVQYVNAIDDAPYRSEGNWYVPVGPLQRMGTEPGGFLIGVGANTAHGEAAVQLLSRVGTDETFRELLLFGVEGQDYEIRDGLRYSLERADGTSYNMSVLSPLANFTGAVPEDHRISVFGQRGADLLQTHQMLVDGSKIWYGFSFDRRPVAELSDTVNEILKAYYNRFSALTSQEYEQMLQEIKEAGGDQILQEIQRQLDAWLEENGAQWQPQ